MIRALSIRQPWATAIMDGAKDIENRTWTPPGLGLGVTPSKPYWLAVHTGKKLWDCKDHEGLLDELAECWPGAPKSLEELDDLPRGCFLGIVEVRRVLHCSDPVIAGNNWATGPLCWELANPIRLVDHGFDNIPSRGRQGIYRPSEAEIATFRELHRRTHAAK